MPYYGGAKGQYLEVKKSKEDEVLAKKMVSADEYRRSGLRHGLSALKKQAADVLRLLADIKQDTELSAVTRTATDLFNLIQQIENDPKRDHFEEDVGEEGVGIDSPQSESSGDLETLLNGATVADARPIGISVVGGAGVASSRPHGTALVASGVAISRPVATAIAGIDPASLGLHINLSPPQ